MIGMTGFGLAECHLEQLDASVEVKSYNNRFLDIVILLPPWLGTLEPWIRTRVTHHVARGTVNIMVKVRDRSKRSTLVIDRNNAQALADGIRKLSREIGIDDTLRLEHLLHFDGIVTMDTVYDINEYQIALEPLFDDALQQFDVARATEGQNTGNNIARHVKRLTHFTQSITQNAANIETVISQRLRQRFNTMLGENTDLNRVYAEIAVQLARHTIDEELSRNARTYQNISPDARIGKTDGKTTRFYMSRASS